MLHQLSTWFQWADSTGLLTFTATILLVLYHLAHPLIKAKLQKEQRTQKLQTLRIADNLAGIIIPEMARMTTLDNQQRKLEAISFINRKLHLLGLSLTDETISAKIESAYHAYQQSNVTVHH
ncbi:MAG: phage holin, LLH family [Lentilactobacillus diolivorans]